MFNCHCIAVITELQSKIQGKKYKLLITMYIQNKVLLYKQARSRLIARSDEVQRTLRSARLDGATTCAGS